MHLSRLNGAASAPPDSQTLPLVPILDSYDDWRLQEDRHGLTRLTTQLPLAAGSTSRPAASSGGHFFKLRRIMSEAGVKVGAKKLLTGDAADGPGNRIEAAAGNGASTIHTQAVFLGVDPR